MNMNVKELSIGQKSAPMHTTTINLPTRKVKKKQSLLFSVIYIGLGCLSK